MLVIILGQAEDVALLQLLTVVVVVGENVYFVQLHGEKVLELFVVLPRVQEELVKLVSVKALVHVEDGEHLELVGSMSDVHIYLRGHCRKARFFNSLLWKGHVDTMEMRIVLQLPVSLNSLELTLLALFTIASSATFLC